MAILWYTTLPDVQPLTLCSCSTCLSFGDEVERELVKEDAERWRRLDEQAEYAAEYADAEDARRDSEEANPSWWGNR